MKKSLKFAIVSILVLLASLMIVSCGGGGGVENTPAVVAATKAFQIYATNESYDTLALAIEALKTKSVSKDVTPWTIKLTRDVTDAGATVSGISKGVVIDFQSYTYTLTSGSSGIIINNGTNEVEISGGTIQVPEGSTLSKTAVITSNSDLKLSGTTLSVNASVNAIESTSGKVSIGAKTTITTKDEKDAIVASNESEVKVTDSEVTITGGLKLSEKAEVDLGQAIYIPTKPIEKDPESTFKAVEENIQPKEGSGVEESSIEEVLHNHTFSEEWDTDENTHWHHAICNGHESIIADKNPHDPVTETESFVYDGIVGTVTSTYCSVCNYLISMTVAPVAPEFDLEEGVYGEGCVVRLTTPNEWVYIYYTTDGTDPTTSSTLYVNPIVLDKNMTIKAISHVDIEDKLLTDSEVVSKTFNVKVANPSFSIKSKSVIDNSSAIVLSCSTDGARIIYTTDGSTPSATNGITYSSTINLTSSCTVKAIAIKDGLEPSDVISAEYYHVNDSSSDSYFTITNGAVSINKNKIGSLPSVLIVPEWINGIRSTAIDNYGFENCAEIQILVLPDSITTIGEFAFRGCSSISSMDIGQYVNVINSSAFSGWTSNQTINDYSGVIKAGALSGCNAKINAIVKDGTQAVTGYSGMTNLYSIYMPNSVRAINHQTFSLCTNLSDITMSGNITAIGSLAFNDCTSIPEITLPAILSEMSLNAFRHWTNSQRISDLSGYLYYNSLTESNARIYTVVPNGTNIIATDDIRNRNEIYGLEIPNSVVEIDNYAFQGTSIERITIPTGAIYLGLELFKDWIDSQIVDYVYNNNYVSVSGDRTSFSGTNAVFNVSFRNGITSISDDAFNGMAGLASISIPSTVTSIGDRVFRNTSISSITIPNSVVSLGDYCFSNCNNLTTIELPDCVTTIGDYCFAGSSKLTTVNLGSGITSIPSHAFDNCPLLTTVIAPNCRGSFLVTVKVPVQQLAVKQIDITVNPTYATSLSGYSTTIDRSSQEIDGDWRVFTYEVPDMLAIDYTVTITLKNANGEVVGSYNSYPEAVTSGNQTSFTKEFYLSAFNSQPKVSKPIFDLVEETYLDGQILTLSCPGSDSIIYTTDGTNPTEFNGTVYSDPITLERTVTIKAVGIKECSRYSDVVTNTYNVKVIAPVFDIEAGHIYQSYQTVALSTSTVGATIRYTLNGTTPNNQSTVYTGPIIITQSCTLKAIAYKNGLVVSSVTSGQYTIDLPNHDVVPPTVPSISITCSDMLDEEIVRFGATFIANISPSPSSATYEWYLDGERLSASTNRCTIADSKMDEGYYYLEVRVLADGRLMSESFVFQYKSYVLGDVSTSGGIVFYDKGFYSDGWRYLEVAPTDLRVINGVPTIDSSLAGYSSADAGYEFGFYRTSSNGSNRSVSGVGTDIGTGKNNTFLLVEAMGSSAYINLSGTEKTGYYPARLCELLTYTKDGVTYDDWFLPSKDELNLIYHNLHEAGLGDFADNERYWSSTDYDDRLIGFIGAWAQDFEDGVQAFFNRKLNNRVRPVRAF